MRRTKQLFRIKSIDEICSIIGAHRIGTGECAFTVIDQNHRERVFLADPSNYDAPSVEILALWADLEPRERYRISNQKSLKRKKEAIAHRRKRNADDLVDELKYKSRLDDVEPELDDADPIVFAEPEPVEEEIAAD